MEAGRVARDRAARRPLRQPPADLGRAQPGRNARRPDAAHLGHHPPLHERRRRLRPLLPRPRLPAFAPGLRGRLPGTDRPADLRRPGAPGTDVLGQEPLAVRSRKPCWRTTASWTRPRPGSIPNKADGTFLLKLPGMLAAMLRAWRIAKRLRGTVRDHFENEVLPPYLDYVRRKRGEDLGGLETPAGLRRAAGPLCPGAGRVRQGIAQAGLLRGLGLHRPPPHARATAGRRRGRPARLSAHHAAWRATPRWPRTSCSTASRAARPPWRSSSKRYGHRTAGEMELAEPRYREDPRQLDSTLQAMRRSDRSPEEIHQEHARRRAEVEKDLPALLARWGGSSFREPIAASIRQTQRLLAYRESGKHYLMMGYELIRAGDPRAGAALAVGPRGVLPAPRRTGALSRARREELLTAAAQRQVRWQSLQRLDMPDVIDSAEPRPARPAAAVRQRGGAEGRRGGRGHGRRHGPHRLRPPRGPRPGRRTTSWSALPPIPAGRRCSSMLAGWSSSAAACFPTGRSWPATSAFPPWSAPGPPSASRTEANSAWTETAG